MSDNIWVFPSQYLQLVNVHGPPLRFSTPHADVEATKLPPSCVQYLTNQASSFYTVDMLEYNLQGLNATGAMSEDCLTLSVWAPAKAEPQARVPVLIFFFGGGQTTGGQDVPYPIPAKWVDRTPDHNRGHV